MPAALTYPGVYVEEIPSGVHTITGVATSITAFIGRASRGPTNQATSINNIGDFDRIFGGLWAKSSLGFAVRDFFLNGGAQAIIIRLYHADPGKPDADPPVNPPLTTAELTVGSLNFTAANEGQWGLALRVTIDKDNISGDAAQAMGLTTADLFNLTVVDSGTNAAEKYLNLTVKESPRRVDKVLQANSILLLYKGTPDATKAITPGKDALGTLENTLAAKKKTLTDLQNAGADPGQVTQAKKDVDTAKKALDDAIGAAVKGLSDGLWLSVLDFLPQDGLTKKIGLFALEQTDLFNILCIPPYHAPTETLDVDVNLISAAGAYCEKRRAMLVVDAPKDWNSTDTARKRFTDTTQDNVGTNSSNAALYFPRLSQPNPLHDGQVETFAPCGAIAGIWARTDSQRVIWKAPAGIDASVVGAPAFSVQLTDDENGELNPLGINCLRGFPVYGRIVWGARTLRGADQLADQYKYVPVRRLALYIEESLYRGLKWVVFEPNDEPLWAQIRLNVGAFMHTLFRKGAFQGTTPAAAYFVKCDKETTTQNDIDLGVVNIVVGFAPLKPAEFVVIQLQQIAGQIEV
jgi:phage tail sheath protein FI